VGTVAVAVVDACVAERVGVYRGVGEGVGREGGEGWVDGLC